MAATGKAASKKAELSAYNQGDEGYYEADGGDGIDDVELYEEMMGKKAEKVYKRPTATAKEIKARQDLEDFERRKAMGAVHLTPSEMSKLREDEEQQKVKRMAERLKQQDEEETRRKLAAQREEKQRLKQYRKSSAYKRKCWADRVKVREQHEAEWGAVEKHHRELEAEFKAARELVERQRLIDDSWRAKPPSSPEKTAAPAPAKPQPKPKPKGKKGKTVDLSKYGGSLPAAALAKKQEPEGKGKSEECLPWDPEKGEKDPNRPLEEKRGEEQAWERRQRAWKKHLEEWSKVKAEHTRVVQVHKDEGLYDSEPEFHTDPASDVSSDSDSDSDF